MSDIQLIADSGATKTTWMLLNNSETKAIKTQGISPYFLSETAMEEILRMELLPNLLSVEPDEIHFYGTGCATAENKEMLKRALKTVFTTEKIQVDRDLMAAARALCGQENGVACILGTGSNSCVFNGEDIIKSNPSLGFILADEGSGAHMGKKLLQYYIYNTLDEELMHKFNLSFNTNYKEILHHVYKEPLPNRYLASFAVFLSENRGHYMIENIIEDCISDFFSVHLYKYAESWTLPIHFTGSIAWHFKDVILDICAASELQAGRILQSPMDGLIEYHRNNRK